MLSSGDFRIVRNEIYLHLLATRNSKPRSLVSSTFNVVKGFHILGEFSDELAYRFERDCDSPQVV